MQFYLDRGKRPEEKIRIGIDFVNDIVTPATISSLAVTILDDNGTDFSGTMLSSSTNVNTKCYAVVQAGTDGQRYRAFFKATCSDGLIYEHSIEFRVKLNG